MGSKSTKRSSSPKIVKPVDRKNEEEKERLNKEVQISNQTKEEVEKEEEGQKIIQIMKNESQSCLAEEETKKIEDGVIQRKLLSEFSISSIPEETLQKTTKNAPNTKHDNQAYISEEKSEEIKNVDDVWELKDKNQIPNENSMYLIEEENKNLEIYDLRNDFSLLAPREEDQGNLSTAYLTETMSIPFEYCVDNLCERNDDYSREFAISPELGTRKEVTQKFLMSPISSLNNFDFSHLIHEETYIETDRVIHAYPITTTYFNDFENEINPDTNGYDEINEIQHCLQGTIQRPRNDEYMSYQHHSASHLQTYQPNQSCTNMESFEILPIYNDWNEMSYMELRDRLNMIEECSNFAFSGSEHIDNELNKNNTSNIKISQIKKVKPNYTQWLEDISTSKLNTLSLKAYKCVLKFVEKFINLELPIYIKEKRVTSIERYFFKPFARYPRKPKNINRKNLIDFFINKSPKEIFDILQLSKKKIKKRNIFSFEDLPEILKFKREKVDKRAFAALKAKYIDKAKNIRYKKRQKSKRNGNLEKLIKPKREYNKKVKVIRLREKGRDKEYVKKQLKSKIIEMVEEMPCS
jgi:hypothetical protein